MLPRTNLSSSALNPCPFILLQTLLLSRKIQLLCNQANPNSLGKTPGSGVYLHKPPAWNQQLTNSSFLSLRRLRVLCVSALSIAVDLLALCFHILTNPFSRNLFRFTSIQIPRGCGGYHFSFTLGMAAFLRRPRPKEVRKSFSHYFFFARLQHERVHDQTAFIARHNDRRPAATQLLHCICRFQ